MVIRHSLNVLCFVICFFSVGAASADEDTDLITWKVKSDDGSRKTTYENVNLKQTDFLVVCLAGQFEDDKSVTGTINIETAEDETRFEWKTFDGEGNRIKCFDDETTNDICYITDESKCSTDRGDAEELSFGYCKKAQSIIISRDSFTISCGDEVVIATLCAEKAGDGPWNFITNEFKPYICATRLRPLNSKWIDVLSGEGVGTTINFGSNDLLIHLLVIRENLNHLNEYNVKFRVVGKEGDEDDMTVNLKASSSPYKTRITLSATTVCDDNPADNKIYNIGGNGQTEIRIVSTGDQIALVFKDKENESHELWIDSCQPLLNDLTMVFEDPEARRNLTLFGNTNIKIVPKDTCPEPVLVDPDLKFEDVEATYEIGSEVQLGCVEPKYHITSSNTIKCQLDKTWTEFPSCTKKTCEETEVLGKNGSCIACPEDDCSLTCLQPNVADHNLKFDNASDTMQLGAEIKVVCIDPMFHIIGEDMIYCESDETWSPLEFPSCTKKTCAEGKYLAQDGTCVGSKCPKGQYASEGEGLCLDCKNEGEKFYADTKGSSSCKICDWEVDTKRTFCAMHQDGAKPAPDNADDSGAEIKRYIYIALAGVAVVVHILALGIRKWRHNYHSKKQGSEYFAWRFKKYNSTKISHKMFSKQEPEISIQYKFPEALLALEGQKSRDEIVQDEEEAGDIYSSKKQSHRSGESSDDEQGNPFAVEVEVKGIYDYEDPDAIDPDPLYDDLEGMVVKNKSAIGIDLLKGTSESVSRQEIDDDVTYQGISEIPFPSTSGEIQCNAVMVDPVIPLGVDSDQPAGYEDVSLMPLPSKTDSLQNKDKSKSTSDAEPIKSTTLKKTKTFKDLALNTLKKDGTLKKDLTKKKNDTLNKKDNTLRRNTIKKGDSTVDNSSTGTNASKLEKDFADLEKMLQFDDWTEDIEDDPAEEEEPTTSASKSKGKDKLDDSNLGVSYSDDTYAVMEYSGDTIQLYESMASAGTLKTYNDITTVSATDKEGVTRYKPLGAETEEDAVYTRSTRQSVKRDGEGEV